MGTSMFGNETLKFTESHKENCAETNPQSFTGGGGGRGSHKSWSSLLCKVLCKRRFTVMHIS